MGFEKTDDRQISSAEGFETDVIDLDGGISDDIKTVKAPRRSSRKEPRFGTKRDRLGRRETNTDDASDNNDELVAPVRPVRLSGTGAVHIQKPVMREGSEFAYLFTDQDEDENDRHMDREKASRLDALAYDEKTDGEGDMYADLFSQTEEKQPPGNKGPSLPERREIPEERPESPRASENRSGFTPRRQAATASASAQPAADESGKKGETPKKRSIFNRHSRSSGNNEEKNAAERDPGNGRQEDRMSPGGRYDNDRYYEDHDRGHYDRYYDGYDRGRYDGDRYDYDRYDDRYYDGYDYGRYDHDRYDDRYYDDYDRQYDRRYDDRDPERRRGRYERYRRDPDEYELVYPQGGYQPVPTAYPSIAGTYQPVYYTPAYTPAPVAPVQYVQGAVYGVPVQGVPVAGMPIQGVPVQGMTYPVTGGYNYTYEPAQQPVQGNDGEQVTRDSVKVVPKEEAVKADTPTAPEPEPEYQPRSDIYEQPDKPLAQDRDMDEPPVKQETGSRFNRRDTRGRERQEPGAASARTADETAAASNETLPEVPSEDSIPHFRPRSRSRASAAQESSRGDSGADTANANAANANAAKAGASDVSAGNDMSFADSSGARDQSGSKPAEPRFRRRHS